MGVEWLAGHEFGTLSSGERTRVLLARSLMNEPAIVLLDEPATGLDLAGREQLVVALSELAADPTSPPFVMVSHHVEDVPTNLTHALLLRGGRMLGSGVLDEMLTSEALSDCFGLALPGGATRRRPVQRVGAAGDLNIADSASVPRRTSSSRIRPSTLALHSSPL